VVDGLYQGVTALSRLASGFLADRWRKHKETALAGYALSAFCKPAFLVVGKAWPALAALIALDRTGKGIRTAPRDALISLHSQKENLGASFGIHRSLDTVGAVVGPMTAFLILSKAPAAYDAIFVVSFCMAILGLGILALFVQNRQDQSAQESTTVVSLRAILLLLKEKRFRLLIIFGGLLSLATMSDSFIYLGLQQHMNIPNRFFPMLYLGTSFFYILFSTPLGVLADRTSRAAIFVGGHVLLLGVYSAPWLNHLGIGLLFLYLALFGAYFAATDGVLMALAAEVLPTSFRASGMALLATITNLGRLGSSIEAGWLWNRGPHFTSTVFLVTLFISLVLSTGSLEFKRPA
jgi:MFS family permease